MNKKNWTNKEHNEALAKSCVEVIRIVAGNPELEVVTELSPKERLDAIKKGQSPDDIWYRKTEYDRITGEKIREYVRIPENVLESGEFQAMGIAAHEGAHSSITRLVEAGAEKLEGELGFMAVLMSLEERPTDQEVRYRFTEYGKWLDLARYGNLLKSESELTTEKSIKSSKLTQICNLLVYQPHTYDFSNYDSDVLELYEKIRSDVEFVENCLPKVGSDETERIKMCKVRLSVLASKIWPKIKHLVENDLSQELIDQILQNILNGELKLPDESEENSGAGSGSVLIELPPDLAELISKKLNSSKKSGEDLSKLPKVKLSDEQIQSLKEALSKLPDKIQQKIKNATEQKIAEEEQKIVDEHSPKITERPRTALEIKKEIEENLRKHQENSKLQKQKEIEDKIKVEQEKIRREQAELLEQTSHYDRVYAQVREIEKDLYKKLEPIFHPSIKAKVKLKQSGTRINLPAVFRWEAARAAGQLNSPKFFESSEKPEKKDYAITILVDLSGSMQGEKIQETFKAIVILTECLNRLGIKFEVLGYQENVIEYKKFNDKIDDVLRRKISGMEDAVGGGNDDGPCLLHAADNLAKQQSDRKILIVLSDGVSNDPEELHSAVKKIRNESKISLIGLGLGAGTEHVKNYYPVSIPDIDADSLKEVLPDLISDILLNPKKYQI